MRSPHPTTPRRLRSTTLIAIGACLLAAAVAPATAHAASRHTPAKATHIVLAAATSSSLTVTTAHARYARTYMLYVSSVKSDLYYANLTRNRHSKWRHWATASGPRITVRRLNYTTKPYWFRVRTINGPKSAYSSTIRSAGVLPGTPTSVRVSDVGGLSLTWSDGSATGFVVRQATNSRMTTGARWWKTSGNTHQFTPYGIKAGQRYWFKVRAVNNGTLGHYSSVVSGVTGAHEQNLRVVTYNVLQTRNDGHKVASGTTSPWSKRGPAAASLIKRAKADVIAVQEAGGWVKPYEVRQVDSLLRYLGSGYGLAHTEVTWQEHKAGTSGYVRVYSYIIYKKSTVQAVGAGGHFGVDSSSVADPHWAAYQQLRAVRTGAKFLMVSTHLPAGYGVKMDTRRQSETKTLISKANQLAGSLGVKVVYGGDFNTNLHTGNHPLDGPGAAMRSARIADSRLVAQSHVNNYSSYNALERTPRRYPQHSVDYVFVPAGVSAAKWLLALNVSRGKLVGTIPSDHNPVCADVVIRY